MHSSCHLKNNPGCVLSDSILVASYNLIAVGFCLLTMTPTIIMPRFLPYKWLFLIKNRNLFLVAPDGLLHRVVSDLSVRLMSDAGEMITFLNWFHCCWESLQLLSISGTVDCVASWRVRQAIAIDRIAGCIQFAYLISLDPPTPLFTTT